MQQCNPHRRVPHPLAGVLSLDTAGPLTPATDQGGQLSRYFLAGAFTWAIPKASNRTTEEEPEAEGEEELPMIEAEREKEEDKGKDEEQGEVQEDQEITERHRETISDAEEREGREVGHLQEELSPGEMKLCQRRIPILQRTSKSRHSTWHFLCSRKRPWKSPRPLWKWC